MHAIGVFESDEILRDIELGIFEYEMPLADSEFENAEIQHDLAIVEARSELRTNWIGAIDIVDVVEGNDDWIIRCLRQSSADHLDQLFTSIVVGGDRGQALGDETLRCHGVDLCQQSANISEVIVHGRGGYPGYIGYIADAQSVDAAAMDGLQGGMHQLRFPSGAF